MQLLQQKGWERKSREKITKIVEQGDRSMEVGLIVLLLKITGNRLDIVIFKNDYNKDFSFSNKT